MKIQAKFLIFLFVSCISLVSLSDAACETPKCFDCSKCNKDCTNVKQDCDSDCLVEVRQFLCTMENANCNKVNGCDVAPIPITIYPAANYDESQAAWKSETIQTRKNCCYNLTGIYDNTLSGLKNNGACVTLYDGADCTGTSLKVDSSWTLDCLKFIDCPARINARGIKFNDKASSFQLC